MKIKIKETKEIPLEPILNLYKQNKWLSAERPEHLYKALLNSHSLISAWDGDLLVGLANAISDGYLIVYYPHVLVLPNYHDKGVGKQIMDRLTTKYQAFHRQMLTADKTTTDFYEDCGFERAGNTETMWIYPDHT